MDLKLHDIVEMKKEHPCGSRRWEVLRVGMDLKLRCTRSWPPAESWRKVSNA